MRPINPVSKSIDRNHPWRQFCSQDSDFDGDWYSAMSDTCEADFQMCKRDAENGNQRAIATLTAFTKWRMGV